MIPCISMKCLIMLGQCILPWILLCLLPYKCQKNEWENYGMEIVAVTQEQEAGREVLGELARVERLRK